MANIIEALNKTGRAVWSNGTVDVIVQDGEYGSIRLHNHDEKQIYAGDLKAATGLLKEQNVPLDRGWIAQEKRK